MAIIMHQKLLTLLFLLCFAALPAYGQSASEVGSGFFYYVEDLPLMPGVEELVDQSVMFDKPDGRIVQSVAIIKTPLNEEVVSYYKTILPQFGWEMTGNNGFVREREYLRFRFDSYGGQRFLHVILGPER